MKKEDLMSTFTNLALSENNWNELSNDIHKVIYLLFKDCKEALSNATTIKEFKDALDVFYDLHKELKTNINTCRYLGISILIESALYNIIELEIEDFINILIEVIDKNDDIKEQVIAYRLTKLLSGADEFGYDAYIADIFGYQIDLEHYSILYNCLYDIKDYLLAA